MRSRPLADNIVTLFFTICRGVDVEAGQQSRSLPGQDEWKRPPLPGTAQRAPTAAAELELAEINDRSIPPVARSRSSRLFGLKDRRQSSADSKRDMRASIDRPDGRGSIDRPARDRRFSLDRRGSNRLPEAFGNVGRVVRKKYQACLRLKSQNSG